MIDKIKKILKNKKLYYIILFIVIIIFYIYFSSNNSEDNKILKEPVSTSIPKNTFVLPKRQGNSQVYQINRFETESEIFNYGWNGKKIAYSTKEGVFDLWNNNIIINTSATNTYFNNNGSVVYTVGSKSYLYKQSDKAEKELGSNLFGIQINKDNTTIIFQNKGIINIKNLYSEKIFTKEIPTINEVTFGFIKDKDYVYINNKVTKLVSIYDFSFNLVKEYRLPDNYFFIEVSPEGEYILSSSNNYLHFSNFNSEIKTISFDKDSEIEASWINKDKAIIVETRKRDSMDISDNYIWIIDKTGSKLFITNSFPVRNNFNSKIKPVINSDNNAIMLSENKGNIWIISLIPSKIPVYEETGINFFNIDTKREDNFED